MKVGFNLLLWTGVVTEEHLPVMEKIKKMGGDGVEIPMFSLDASPWEKLATELDALELGRTTVVVLPADASLIDSDVATRKRGIEFLKGCVDACQVLGAEAIGGPIYNPVGKLSGRGPTDDEIKFAVEGLRAVGEHAQGSGVVLAIEPLNRFETYFVNTQADCAKLVDAIGLDTVGQMYDTFHANIEEKDPIAAIQDGGARINHVHICANDRGTPGEDHIPWEATFASLKSLGYETWLTIEAFGHRIPELAAATCIWREVSPSEDHVVLEGIKHIRSHW